MRVGTTRPKCRLSIDLIGTLTAVPGSGPTIVRAAATPSVSEQGPWRYLVVDDSVADERAGLLCKTGPLGLRGITDDGLGSRG